MIFCSLIKISLQIFTPLNSIFQEISYPVVVVLGFRIVVHSSSISSRQYSKQYLLTYIASKPLLLVFLDAYLFYSQLCRAALHPSKPSPLPPYLGLHKQSSHPRNTLKVNLTSKMAGFLFWNHETGTK